MKKLFLLIILTLFILTSCKKNDSEVFFKIGKDLEYKFSDIELYDTSTNVMYFKTIHDEFSSIEKNTFAFLNNGDAIYSGTFWPGYSSSIPTGPLIYSPPILFGNYALRIENWSPEKPDVRSDPRIIALLKQHDLLHSGLSISSISIDINGTQLSLTITISNNDQSDLLIIDPDKTGLNLFHYFTNGLSIFDSANNEVFSSNIQPQVPDPWNSWNIDWLSKLKAGESKDFRIIYSINKPLNPGEYRISFSFPGLEYQISRDQLHQDNSRIWLGDKRINKKITLP
jgi:hypothetical protein